jgi:hypothetical protein
VRRKIVFWGADFEGAVPPSTLRFNYSMSTYVCRSECRDMCGGDDSHRFSLHYLLKLVFHLTPLTPLCRRKIRILASSMWKPS